jgi:exodeoxyribonuclease V alpha subunit
VWRELLSEGDTAATEETVKTLLENRIVDPEACLRLAEENGALRRIGTLLRAPGAAWLEDQVVSALLAIENTRSNRADTDRAGNGILGL